MARSSLSRRVRRMLSTFFLVLFIIFGLLGSALVLIFHQYEVGIFVSVTSLVIILIFVVNLLIGIFITRLFELILKSNKK